MNIQIKLLKNHPETIPQLAQIWYEVLGKIWLPEVPIERVEQKFLGHSNNDIMPLTFVAFHNEKPVGMCSLRENDGIRSNLTPWLASLVVDPAYQKQSIAQLLIDSIKQKAIELRFEKLYLFAFDLTIPSYYGRLGWQKIGMDVFNDHPVTLLKQSGFVFLMMLKRD